MEFSRDDTKLVKAIAVILMLFHHLFAFSYNIMPPNNYISLFNIFGNDIEFWIGIFGDVCISIFTFIGGYGTYKACSNTKKWQMLKKIFDKIVKIYFVYWTVFIIFISFGIIFKLPFVCNNITDFWGNFWGLTFTYNKEWWFLTPYILLLIIFPLLKLLIKKTPFLFDLILIFIINHIIYFKIPSLIDYNLLGPDKPLNNLVTALNLLPCFMMGCLIAKWDLLSKIKNKFLNNFIFKVISIIMFILLIFIRNKYGDSYDFLYAFIISICTILIFDRRNVIKEVLVSIGKESTIIWLTHTLYCYYICQNIVYFPKISIVIVIWLLIMCYLTSITIKILIKKIEKLVSITIAHIKK